MKEIKRIGIKSLAKIYGLIMAITGMIVGIFVGFIMFFFGSFVQTDGPLGSLFGAGLGIIGFLFMPLFYGLLGFIFGGLSAFFYNMLASWVGGIEIELSDKEENSKL